MIVALVRVQTFTLESCMTVRYSLITGISYSLRVLDDGYFREVRIKLIIYIVLQTLDWSVSARVDHPPSKQCFSTDMINMLHFVDTVYM